MKRQRIPSSGIISVGYDEGKHVLEVEFISGEVYRYYDVPHDVAEEFFLRPVDGSYGKHINLFIKEFYRYEKV